LDDNRNEMLLFTWGSNLGRNVLERPAVTPCNADIDCQSPIVVARLIACFLRLRE
jgi:hypothetical protein